MGCSAPGSSVHGVLQARVLEGVATSFSGASCQPRGQVHVPCVCRQTLYTDLPGRPIPTRQEAAELMTFNALVLDTHSWYRIVTVSAYLFTDVFICHGMRDFHSRPGIELVSSA